MAKIIKFPKKNNKFDMQIEVTLVDMERIRSAYDKILPFCYGLEATKTVNFEELTYALLEATINSAHLSNMSAAETVDMFQSVEIEEQPEKKH